MEVVVVLLGLLGKFRSIEYAPLSDNLHGAVAAGRSRPCGRLTVSVFFVLLERRDDCRVEAGLVLEVVIDLFMSRVKHRLHGKHDVPFGVELQGALGHALHGPVLGGIVRVEPLVSPVAVALSTKGLHQVCDEEASVVLPLSSG